ncbi:MAG: hypothetical protein HZB50_17040 [Chloroflexi bacterium]|nr:hypothetical protein [Chloroflexota bacterium]
MAARKWIAASLLLITGLACRYLIPNWEEPPTIVSPPFESPLLFENENFSFTIPAKWQTMEQLWGQQQVPDENYYALGVKEIIMITSAREQADGTYSTYFAVASSPLAGGIDLETRFRQTYDPLLPDLREASQQKFDNGALSGFEITYQRAWGEPWWQFHDIWVEKDAVIYVLSFHAAPNDFERHQTDFDLILDSFNLK